MTVQRYDTEVAWLGARSDSIGASEVGSLFDCGWVTREALIAEKVSGVRRPRDRRAISRMNAGKLLEPVIGALLGLEFRRLLVPCGWTIYRSPSHPHLHATPDFWLIEGEELVEAKATGPDGLSAWGSFTSRDGDRWWKWNDEPPLKVTLQVHAQLAATGAKVGHVACLSGTDLKTWTLQRDEELIAEICARVVDAVREITEQREQRNKEAS